MRRRFLFFPLISISLLFPTFSRAQQWSGIIAPSRAIDWSTAGIPGGIPSGSWTQCGSTIAAYGTSSSPASPSTINNAIAACGTKEYVLLGSGDFYLNGVVDFTGHSNVVLRGQGANSTRLHFLGTTLAGCNGWWSAVCVAGSNTYEGGFQGSATWTGNYSQGSTTITLDNVSGIVPNLTPIVLDQCNTGLTGSSCTGSAADNSNVFVCEVVGTCSSQGANTGLHRVNRAQEEVVIATAITGSGPYTVTLLNPIKWPGWASGHSPQAWWGSSTITNSGVEDFAIDASTIGQRGVTFSTAYKCWAMGITTTTTNYYAVFNYISSHDVVRDSYFYWTSDAGTESYGIGGAVSGDLLMENNIMQGITDPINFDSQCSGCVAGYNYAVNQYDTTLGYMFGMFSFHGAGESDILLEGNIGSQPDSDNIWGTHTVNTMFRNYFNGYESNNGTMPTDNADPMHVAAFSRYYNLIGNVLGNPLHHTTYECIPAAATTSECSDVGVNTWVHVYDIGWSGNTHGHIALSGSPNDYALTASTLFRWGNYDVVSGAPQWNSSEVPTSDPYFPNAVPGSHTLPPSFYNGVTGTFPSCGTGLSFWKNPTTGTCPPFPAIGPDVSSGPLQVCSSGTYKYSVVASASQCAGGTSQAAIGGYAYAIPAMACYLNVMGGKPDGTGSMLSFNRASCYADDPSSGSGAPAPPTGLSASVQ
jgi:hypothetical protein